MTTASRIEGSQLLDTLPVSVFRITRDFTIDYINEFACRQLNCRSDEIVGNSGLELGLEPDLWDTWKEELRTVFTTGQPSTFEYLCRQRGDRLLEFRLAPEQSSTGKVHAVIVAAVSIDEVRRARDKAETRLQQLQKIESLGLLAAGAAHDFNNLLTMVLGHASLGRLALDPHSPVVENLRAIEDAASQMGELCQQMLAFAGHGRRESRPVNLNFLAQDTARLLRGMLPDQVSVKFDLATDPPCVFGDETQFRQVVLNLLTNAADAIGDKPGTIEIHTGLEIPSAATLEDAGYEPRSRAFAVLQVSDDGPGMPADVKARIFEPFFTTKATGRGIGLAALQGIVRAHGGLLNVDSTVGLGSTFRVLIPVKV